MPAIDPREFRNALGAFATGVTVVTTSDTKGHPFALTVNSFTSVSLDPPLVLWCVNRAHGEIFDAFSTAGHYAVHVLQEEQERLSRHFIAKTENRFADIEYERGIAGLPLLPNCCARLQCSVEHRYEGGDHLMLVGRVIDMTFKPAPPLVFHAGQYRRLAASKAQD